MHPVQERVYDVVTWPDREIHEADVVSLEAAETIRKDALSRGINTRVIRQRSTFADSTSGEFTVLLTIGEPSDYQRSILRASGKPQDQFASEWDEIRNAFLAEPSPEYDTDEIIHAMEARGWTIKGLNIDVEVED
jgi:hypothetical protein